MSHGYGVAPCFQGQPVNATQPVSCEMPLARTHIPLMLTVSEEDYPIRVEDRAKRIRDAYRRIGITSPGDE